MRKLALIAALALGLACATPAPQRPDQAVYAACAAYSIAAERGAEAAQAGLLPFEAVVELRAFDSKMYVACKSAFAMIRAGEPADSARLAVTAEFVNRALAEFERILAERIERGGRRQPVDPETGEVVPTPAPAP